MSAERGRSPEADKNVRAPQKKELPTTRRKQEGAVYTPAFITRYIVGQALGGVLKQRFEALRREHEAEGHTLEQLRHGLYDEMAARGIKALLLIDSLDTRVDASDKYDIAKNEVNMATSALLKCLASFSNASQMYDARFCLPSERHYQFLDLSTNPAKDLVNHVALSWHAKELVCIAAHRLALFYREHAQYSGHFAANFGSLDPTKKSHAMCILRNEIVRPPDAHALEAGLRFRARCRIPSKSALVSGVAGRSADSRSQASSCGVISNGLRC